MPALDKHLAQGGTRLSDFTVPTPVCCPARAALLTGQYPHCSNVTANFYPAGAYQKFVELGLDSSYLPVWLQGAGYDTYIYGKFLNQYVERSRYQPPGYYPRGWTVFQALTHENTYAYYNSCFALNGSLRECFPGQYQTDLIKEMATGTIRATAALGRPRPFLLYLAPAAPHLESSPQRPMGWTTPRPARRHASLYADENVTLPRSPNYDAPDPLLRRPPVDGPAQARFQQQYLARLRCMRAIDEMLDAVVTELSTQGMLDSTYIIYTSDNGYHFGSFRLGGAKARPIEEDIHVPFYIRGPGVPAGQVLPYQGSMVDVAPTVLALAGLPIPPSVNGLPLPVAGRLVGPHARALQASLPPGALAPPLSAVWWQRDAVLVEGWRSSGEVDAQDGDSRTSVYKALRLCTDYRVFTDSGARGGGGAGGPPPRIAGTLEGWSCYKYVAWCGGNQRAFHDLSTEPYDLRDRLPDVPSRVVDRFDGILSSLIHCRGAACRNPYAALHPGQRVYNLTGAANPSYDDMYRALYKLKYDRCLPVYDPRYERTWTQHLGPLL